MFVMQANDTAPMPPRPRRVPSVEAMPSAINIVIVGGDPLFREGLKSLFARNETAAVGEYDAGSMVRNNEYAVLGPQIVLAIPPQASSADDTSWVEALSSHWPGANIVVLAMHGEDHLLTAALKAGAKGCLFSDMAPEALVQALRLVALGENVFPTRIGKALLRQHAQSNQPNLTPRERDILQRLMAGLSNKMIANELGTTDMTVKAQLRHLLRKLGVANRTQAALWAREHGLDKETAH